MYVRHAVRASSQIALVSALAISLAACGKDEHGASNPEAVAGASGSEAGSGNVAGAGGGVSVVSAAGSGGPAAGPSGGRAGRGAAGSSAAASGGTSGNFGAAGATTAAGMQAGTSGASGTSGAAAGSGASSAPAADGCTRDFLRMTVDAYFTALAAHDPKPLPTAASVKFTENGKALQLGEGLWAKAGAVKFKESLFDTQRCGTVTQAVVADGSTDTPVALRLALEAQKITEVETIVVRSGDYIVDSNPANMIALMSNGWGMTVPEDQRQTRDELEKWIDKYFRMFPMGGCSLASDCKRMENGFTLACSAGATCGMGEPTGSGVMKPRIILVDVEAGMAAGFTMFQGRYSDVHMIKYSGGEVHGVHTVLGEASSSGWD